jgi:hypothetical protein
MPGFSEKDMEDVIAENPDKYLEPGLRLIARQYSIGSYIFDLLFEDRHGTKLIVEIQKGTLDRTHTFKILDYYHEFKAKHHGEFIDLMVIANNISVERKTRLKDLGIEFRELPESIFIKDVPAQEIVTAKNDGRNDSCVEEETQNINKQKQLFSHNQGVTIIEEKYTLQSRFEVKGSSLATVDLFNKFNNEMKSIADDLKVNINCRVHDRGVTYYASNAFIFCNFNTNNLGFIFRIYGRSIPGIQPCNWIKGNDREGGKYTSYTQNDLAVAIIAAREACKMSIGGSGGRQS